MCKGNGGIGYCLASLLIADASKHVIITSRSVEKGEAALKELQALKQPGTVEMLQLDVTNPDSIKKLAEEVEKKYGRYVQRDCPHRFSLCPVGFTFWYNCEQYTCLLTKIPDLTP